MIKPRMLGHLVIRVRDAQRSEDFYTNVLGLEVRNRTRGGKMRFFTSNPEIDHELAVAEIGEDAVADMDQLKDAFQVVLDNNVDIAGFGDHGVTKGLYIRDPDGIEIELYVLAPEFENTPLQEILTGGTLQGTSAD